MPRSDVLTLSALFLGVAMTSLFHESKDWIYLVIGMCLFALYVAMGRFRIVVHYAGWGAGPNEDMLLAVTQVMQSFVDGKTPDVKASDKFFGRHYQSPRMLKVIFSRGRFGQKKTRLFQEHTVVRLD
jgi:hypothetical protein